MEDLMHNALVIGDTISFIRLVNNPKRPKMNFIVSMLINNNHARLLHITQNCSIPKDRYAFNYHSHYYTALLYNNIDAIYSLPSYFIRISRYEEIDYSSVEAMLLFHEQNEVFYCSYASAYINSIINIKIILKLYNQIATRKHFYQDDIVLLFEEACKKDKKYIVKHMLTHYKHDVLNVNRTSYILSYYVKSADVAYLILDKYKESINYLMLKLDDLRTNQYYQQQYKTIANFISLYIVNNDLYNTAYPYDNYILSNIEELRFHKATFMQIVKNVLHNELRITNYDVNLTNIIAEYIPHQFKY